MFDNSGGGLRTMFTFDLFRSWMRNQLPQNARRRARNRGLPVVEQLEAREMLSAVSPFLVPASSSKTATVRHARSPRKVEGQTLALLRNQRPSWRFAFAAPEGIG